MVGVKAPHRRLGQADAVAEIDRPRQGRLDSTV
jgi:hypothetical protein